MRARSAPPPAPGPLPFVEELMEGRIVEEGLSGRAGMSQLPGGGQALAPAAPGPAPGSRGQGALGRARGSRPRASRWRRQSASSGPARDRRGRAHPLSGRRSRPTSQAGTRRPRGYDAPPPPRRHRPFGQAQQLLRGLVRCGQLSALPVDHRLPYRAGKSSGVSPNSRHSSHARARKRGRFPPQALRGDQRRTQPKLQVELAPPALGAIGQNH